MGYNNLIAENIILPLGDTVTGNSVYKSLKFLLKSQWWSRANLDDWQNERLRWLIQHAYDNVPHYQRVMKALRLTPADIRSGEDLQKLPILTKAEIKADPKSFMAANIRKYKNSSSSGSTGEPLHYRITPEAYSMNLATSIRGWNWAGFRLGDKYAKISQNDRSKLVKRLQDRWSNCLYLAAKQHTDENNRFLLEQINNFKPLTIRGYPDPLLFLANYINKTGSKVHSPHFIATTGNVLFPEAREVIEQTFGAPVYDSYNCEGNINWFQCQPNGCYHGAEEMGISEVVDEEGNSVSVGGTGRLLSTHLYNYASVFIRYDTQDMVQTSALPCSCGRHLKPLVRIEGRRNDILFTPSGKYLIVHNFTGYFMHQPRVRQFQVVQDSVNHLTINLAVTAEYNDLDHEQIKSYWQNYIGDGMDIKLVLLSEIPLLTSGKRRFLIRNIPLPKSNVFDASSIR